MTRKGAGAGLAQAKLAFIASGSRVGNDAQEGWARSEKKPWSAWGRTKASSGFVGTSRPTGNISLCSQNCKTRDGATQGFSRGRLAKQPSGRKVQGQ